MPSLVTKSAIKPVKSLPAELPVGHNDGLAVVERARKELAALHAKLVDLLDGEKIPPLT